jgi:hypothetical protein
VVKSKHHFKWWLGELKDTLLAQGVEYMRHEGHQMVDQHHVMGFFCDDCAAEKHHEVDASLDHLREDITMLVIASERGGISGALTTFDALLTQPNLHPAHAHLYRDLRRGLLRRA